MNTENSIRVRVQELEEHFRVRVERVEHAFWLLDGMLATKALFGLQRIEIDVTELESSFEIPSSRHRTCATLEAALARIPGVQLIFESRESSTLSSDERRK